MSSTDIRLKQELAREVARLTKDLHDADVAHGYELRQMDSIVDELESTLETERADHSHLVRQLEAEKGEAVAYGLHVIRELVEELDELQSRLDN